MCCGHRSQPLWSAYLKNNKTGKLTVVADYQLCALFLQETTWMHQVNQNLPKDLKATFLTSNWYSKSDFNYKNLKNWWKATGNGWWNNRNTHSAPTHSTHKFTALFIFLFTLLNVIRYFWKVWINIQQQKKKIWKRLKYSPSSNSCNIANIAS